MDDKSADLSSLRIDRAESPRLSPKPKLIRRLAIVALLLVVLTGGFFFLRAFLFPAVEVQLATASFTSAAQANAVLTASGYVVARRKAAVASKGTGRLVYLGVEEGDEVKKG